MYKEIQGRWGPVKFLLKDEYVGRSLYYYGEYGPDETEMILGLCRPTKGPWASGLFLDIGANIGCISQAIQFCAVADVVAFEPQPVLFDLLKKNIGRTIHNVAVGAAVGTALMPKLHYSEKNNFGGVALGDKSIYGSIEVPVVTIDSFNYESVGFMKIDTEGYELEVLKGATETIKRCKPIMYIEDDRTARSAALRKYITELGYSIEEHRPALYREKNFFDHKNNVWDKNYASHNLICRYDKNS